MNAHAPCLICVHPWHGTGIFIMLRGGVLFIDMQMPSVTREKAAAIAF